MDDRIESHNTGYRLIFKFEIKDIAFAERLYLDA
jgi:hypothetical protein